MIEDGNARVSQQIDVRFGESWAALWVELDGQGRSQCVGESVIEDRWKKKKKTKPESVVRSVSDYPPLPPLSIVVFPPSPRVPSAVQRGPVYTHSTSFPLLLIVPTCKNATKERRMRVSANKPISSSDSSCFGRKYLCANSRSADEDDDGEEKKKEVRVSKDEEDEEQSAAATTMKRVSEGDRDEEAEREREEKYIKEATLEGPCRVTAKVPL